MVFCTRKGRALWIVNFVGFLFFLWGAEPGFSEVPTGQSPWFGEIETGLIYDNNIFQEKDSRESDGIWESSLFFGYQLEKVFLSGTAVFDRYLENEVLNYAFYEVGVEAPLGLSNEVSLFFSFSPTAPLDKADSGPPFELSSRSLTLLVDHELFWGRIGFSFSVTRLSYSEAFEAKDSKIITLGPSLFYKWDDPWTLSVAALFEKGQAAGGFISRQRDDISYRAGVLSLQARYELSSRLNVRLSYRVRHKRFTAEAADPIHAGRRDRYQMVLISADYALYPHIVLRPQIEESWTRSSDPFVAFKERRLSLFTTYLF